MWPGFCRASGITLFGWGPPVMTGSVSGFITDEVSLNIIRDHEPVAHFAWTRSHPGLARRPSVWGHRPQGWPDQEECELSLDYCGRRYYDSGPQQGSPALFKSQDSATDAHWTFLSWTFSGRSIYADVNPVHPPYSVCTMVLYVPIGGGKWETYSLSGGP